MTTMDAVRRALRLPSRHGRRAPHRHVGRRHGQHDREGAAGGPGRQRHHHDGRRPLGAPRPGSPACSTSTAAPSTCPASSAHRPIPCSSSRARPATASRSRPRPVSSASRSTVRPPVRAGRRPYRRSRRLPSSSAAAPTRPGSGGSTWRRAPSSSPGTTQTLRAGAARRIPRLPGQRIARRAQRREVRCRLGGAERQRRHRQLGRARPEEEQPGAGRPEQAGHRRRSTRRHSSRPSRSTTRFGARPGRATPLPVLLNDYDPNGDVLVDRLVHGHPRSSRGPSSWSTATSSCRSPSPRPPPGGSRSSTRSPTATAGARRPPSP